MNKILYIALFIIFLLNQKYVSGHVHAPGEDHEEGEEHIGHDHVDDNKEQNAIINFYGIIIILISSFIGTIIPILFRKKKFFATTSVFFGAVKLFGIGVITSVAFIHMLVPANQLLTCSSAPKFFRETYPSFSGAFAIIGIIITNAIQVLASHLLQKKAQKKHSSAHSEGSDSEQTVSSNSYYTTEKKLNTTAATATTTTTVGGGNGNNEKKNYNGGGYGMGEEEVIVSMGHDDCCGVDNLKMICTNVENKEKQVVSYLLEIGISLHSVLIGFVYGLAEDEELVALLIAMVFHQFFEGVALSSIFVEAKFKKLKSCLIMIVVYSLTLPIGGIIGLIVRESYDPTSSAMIGLQGGVDAIAGGILIYDALANVLVRHTSSLEWKNFNLREKGIQLLLFYAGLGVMALIGVWA